MKIHTVISLLVPFLVVAGGSFLVIVWSGNPLSRSDIVPSLTLGVVAALLHKFNTPSKPTCTTPPTEPPKV